MSEYVVIARRPVSDIRVVRDPGPSTIVPAGMRGCCIGDFQQAVVSLVAGGELDQVVGAARRLNDEVIRGLSERESILNGYREASSLRTASGQLPIKSSGYRILPVSESPASATDEATVLAIEAYATATLGIRLLARQVQTLGQLDRVFTAISAELSRAGAGSEANAIDVSLTQVRRFVVDTDNLAFSLAPEYMETKRAILGAAEANWSSAGVGRNAIDDPRWLSLYVEAANDVVPIEAEPPPPGIGLGNPLPVLVTALIWVVGIVAAAVIAARTISRMIPDANSRAITARDILLEAERRKAEETERLRASGASEAEIQSAMNSIDESTRRAVESVPEAGSPVGILLLPVSIIAGYAAGKAAGIF